MLSYVCPCPGWFHQSQPCYCMAASIRRKSPHEFDESAWQREAPSTRYHMSEPFWLLSVDPPIYTNVLLIADILPGCQVSSAVEAATAVRNSKIPRRCVEHQWSCWKGCSFLCFRLSNLEHDINEANEVNIQSTHHIRTYSQQQNKTQFAHFGLARSQLRLNFWTQRPLACESAIGGDGLRIWLSTKKKEPKILRFKIENLCLAILDHLFLFLKSQSAVWGVRQEVNGRGNGSTESHLTILKHNFVFRNKEYLSNISTFCC